MVENKKIKLPPPLQLDSVSPATRLLEKRRLMYEVQKAFEDQKKEFEKEEKRCRVREKELREKDILIQDNLIRFSSFLSQQDTRKTKDLEAAAIERSKINEKDNEIKAAEAKLEALKTQHKRITKKMNKLQEFEEFLKKVQSKYSDEFSDLAEIDTRYRRLSETNRLLQKRHNESGGETDKVMVEMDAYKKETGVQILSATNQIADEQRALQEMENEKANLMIKNEEGTESLLKKTSEHGTILMSIDSLFRKITAKTEAKREMYFIWHKDLTAIRSEEDQGQNPVFTEKNCILQMGVIRAYIEGFDQFKTMLNESVDNTDNLQIKGKKTTQTYFTKMSEKLEEIPEVASGEIEINDFKQFDPSFNANR